MADTDPRQLLYHYTALDAFASIVDHRELWASHIRYLNDTTEQRLIWDLLRERINMRVQTARGSDKDRWKLIQSAAQSPSPQNVYVICFSRDGGDRLSQWRGYGGSGGVSIGFDGNEIQRHASAFLAAHSVGPLKKWCILQKVDYIAATLDERTAGTIDSFMESLPGLPLFVDSLLTQQEVLYRSVAMWSPRFKDRAFREEREWRISIADLIGDNRAASFRTRRSLLVPYIKFDLGKSMWPLISRVVVGPGAHQSETLDAIKMRLDDERVEVEASRIPYRDW